jgi:hypothetical protein
LSTVLEGGVSGLTPGRNLGTIQAGPELRLSNAMTVVQTSELPGLA